MNTLVNNINLTSDQKYVFEKVKNFFQDEENPAIVIMGSAGVGKTTLTKYIADFIIDNFYMSVVAIAPTHKARRVLSKKLNSERVFAIPSFTIASILGKMREHTYIGSHKYSNGSKQKMDRYNCFILDEVSMVCDSDLEKIIDYVCVHDKKLILIGDKCQIPAPSQEIVKKKNVCYKPDSFAFNIENLYELREIVRQASDSPIIKIATYLRDNIFTELDLTDILHGCSLSKNGLVVEHDILYDNFTNDYKTSQNTRIIAYTNEAVRSHNLHVRKSLLYTEPLLKNEILTGYSNVGWPHIVIENGTDYRISSIRKTLYFNINDYSGLSGYVCDLVDIDDKNHISPGLFFIDIQHSSNNKFMHELVMRSEKVNKPFSTKNDYKNYCDMKNRAIFLEDVYKYEGCIVTESVLRKTHPLLFTKVSEVLNFDTCVIHDSELTKKISNKYGDIIHDRLKDNKIFGDSEIFADKYMVVEKDIYYGYAITAHKSQGSTYENVYVDENDFKKISNRWNYRFQSVEQRHKERNQLKYVAYTRASKKLQIVI